MTTHPVEANGSSSGSTVVVTLEQRFDRTPDGRVWAAGPCGRDFWNRYLGVFDTVRVLARLRDTSKPQEGAVEATGPGIVFTGLPYYRGLAQYVGRRAEIRSIALRAIRPGDAVIFRVPSPIATLVAPALLSHGIPYALEVVGDPYDVFSPGAVRHPLRPFIRWKMTRDLMRQAREAIGAAYVTRWALQRRYPCGRFEIGVSDVELPNGMVPPARFLATHDTVVEPGRSAVADDDPPRPATGTMRLITVGTFDQLYKAPDVLVDAVKICVGRGLDIDLTFVGGGIYLDEIRRRAERNGLCDRVHFEGHISSRPLLLSKLDAADLFVLPSRQEGLPRAMIEAMARGLPCLGTCVGGIPELLSEDDLVPPGDAQALATKIEVVVQDGSRLAEMSRRSIERAREFAPEALEARRTAFYRHVLDASVTPRRPDRTSAGHTAGPSAVNIDSAGRASNPSLVMHVTTVGMTLRFLRGQARFMRRHGLELQAISSADAHQEAFAIDEAVRVHSVAMHRRITPLRDLDAVRKLARVLGAARPAIVHAHTPKGGLLGMIAAAVCRIPVRVYTMHGLPMSTATGPRRLLLWLAERLSCALAHQVICCSESLRQSALQHRVCAASKARVVAKGSVSGVDARRRFNPANITAREALAVRREFGLVQGAVVIGFVGRMVPDKGLSELALAWQGLREEIPELHLLLVGPFEDIPLPAETLRLLLTDPRVHLVGEDWDTPRLFAAMDVFCLPSYREGFSVVCLEASAMGLPVVATRVTGCVDAVADGVTGTLVPARDSQALHHALRRYVLDRELRYRHGAAGRARVLADFAQERVWTEIAEMYIQLLRVRVNATAYKRFGKRALDIVLSAIALIVCSPILLAIAIAVAVADGRPVLFRQWRPGCLSSPFRMLKFRTMRDERDVDGRPLPDGERISALGRFLRETSLDELPELWNVFKGDMSLVGPRPLLMQYLDRYTPDQARRHDVRPGITGLAQVSGRNALTWEQKFALDLEYVDTCSLKLDVRILMRTVQEVLTRRNIAEPGHATTREFMGTRSA